MPKPYFPMTGEARRLPDRPAKPGYCRCCWRRRGNRDRWNRADPWRRTNVAGAAPSPTRRKKEGPRTQPKAKAAKEMAAPDRALAGAMNRCRAYPTEPKLGSWEKKARSRVASAEGQATAATSGWGEATSPSARRIVFEGPASERSHEHR